MSTSRGLFRDYEPSDGPSFQALVPTTIHYLCISLCIFPLFDQLVIAHIWGLRRHGLNLNLFNFKIIFRAHNNNDILFNKNQKYLLGHVVKIDKWLLSIMAMYVMNYVICHCIAYLRASCHWILFYCIVTFPTKPEKHWNFNAENLLLGPLSVSQPMATLHHPSLKSHFWVIVSFSILRWQ